VTTDIVPILRVADARVAAAWYGRLGFTVEFEHRFGPGAPAYVGIRRAGAHVHLSEHSGDARPDTLIYVWVDDVDAVASSFGVDVEHRPWGREAHLRDPDGNRLRVAQAPRQLDADAALGDGTVELVTTLERAMWDAETRGDRRWMAAHLADEFTEVGFSGRAYTRDEILDQPVGSIEVVLEDMVVRPMGRDAALVVYRSVEPRGVGHRSSVWRRRADAWVLAFHQGTPAT
jgi:predicted enzyme related to lactoylglutathione lyase